MEDFHDMNGVWYMNELAAEKKQKLTRAGPKSSPLPMRFSEGLFV